MHVVIASRTLVVVAAVLSLSSCVRRVHDSEWHITWKVDGKVVENVQTHGHTCGECSLDDVHAQQLLYYSKLEVCEQQCGDAKDVECRLACDADIELEGRRCVDRSSWKEKNWMKLG